MSRPRIHDHDAVLDLWFEGLGQWAIHRKTGVPYSTVGTIITTGRKRGDPRAVWRRKREDT